MGACRTGGDDGMIRAFAAMPDADDAARQVDETAGDEKRADAAGALVAQGQGCLFDAGQPAYARADEDA